MDKSNRKVPFSFFVVGSARPDSDKVHAATQTQCRSGGGGNGKCGGKCNTSWVGHAVEQRDRRGQ